MKQKNSRIGLTSLAIVATLVAAMLIASLVNGPSSPSRALSTTDRQNNLAEIVTSIYLDHHYLLKAISRYVNGIDTVTRAQLIEQANHYGTLLSRLEQHRQLFEQHATLNTITDEARTISHFQREQNSFTNMRNTTRYGTEADSIAHTQTLYIRLIDALATLVHDGDPTMIYVGTLLSWLKPGDFSDHFDIRSVLDTLGEDVMALELASLEYADHSRLLHNSAQQKLNDQLRFAYTCMAIGIALLMALVISYVRQKYTATQNLRTSNERLTREIEASTRLTEQLEYRATHDALSGLVNRSGFQARLDSILAQPDSGNHGLCFIDLDMFKIVNDTSGHNAGDALIKRVAATLKSCVPANMHLARFGGDEFLILAKNCDPDTFKMTIHRCCCQLSPLDFRYDGHRYAVTASFGATQFESGVFNRHQLMNIVDAACYEAKRAGGSRVYFHTEDNSALANRQLDMEWVQRVQDALQRDRFRLFHQPIARIDPSNGKPVHSWEILIRMIDDDGQVLLPGKFLDIAERYGLASRIDRWVVTHTFAWLNENSHSLDCFDCVNINLSGKSIGDSEFLQFLEEQTEQLSISTQLVCFEVTETTVVGDDATATLMRLKELGFQLALDDFGSGFSSFGYLEALPVDYIKIDGMFVRDIDTNSVHREFVKAINAVGNTMGKQIVAEFVENEASLAILHTLGVDFAQGYHIAKPSELPALLDDRSNVQQVA